MAALPLPERPDLPRWLSISAEIWPLRLTTPSRSPLPCHDGVMGSQRFRAVIAAGPRYSAVVMVPFDPDEAWGARPIIPSAARSAAAGSAPGPVPADRGWVLFLTPKRLISLGIAIGDEVMVELAPEGPQRGDLADDIAAALAVTRRRARSSIRWRSSTARLTCAGLTRPPACRICARPALLRSSACSRRESKNGHGREAGCPARAEVTAPIRPL